MDWLVDLLRREERLKQRIVDFGRSTGTSARLAGGTRSPDQDSIFRRFVQPEIEQIQAALEDYLCGRNEDECYRMSYEVSLNLPVFSHLHNLYQPGYSEEI